MFFFFQDLQEEITIEKLKEITKRIVSLNFRNKNALSENQIELGKEISRISFNMFSKRKLEKKSFTVCNNKFLKKVQIEEDADGISEQNIPKVQELLQNNTEAFHELLAQCFISKKVNVQYKTDNQLFYINQKSRFSSKLEDVFFIRRSGEFFMFFDRVTDIPLEKHITDFFGDIDNLTATLNEIKADGQASHEDIQNRLTIAFAELNDVSSDEQQFQEGVISFFDFLGWKGLWLSNNGTPLKDVSSLIEDFRQKLKEHTTALLPDANGIEISKLISISDTIALFTPRVSVATPAKLLQLHASMARYILEKCVMKQYPIRGAITYGKYNFMNNVMIGPGIDECASWHEKCDWIGVHFTPSAQFVIDDAKISNIENIKHSEHIPTKNGLPRIRYCIDWKIDRSDFQNLVSHVKALLPEVASKYLNTYKFLYQEIEKGGV